MKLLLRSRSGSVEDSVRMDIDPIFVPLETLNDLRAAIKQDFVHEDPGYQTPHLIIYTKDIQLFLVAKSVH